MGVKVVQKLTLGSIVALRQAILCCATVTPDETYFTPFVFLSIKGKNTFFLHLQYDSYEVHCCCLFSDTRIVKQKNMPSVKWKKIRMIQTTVNGLCVKPTAHQNHIISTL
jgi:hypothetical protein